MSIKNERQSPAADCQVEQLADSNFEILDVLNISYL